MSLMIRSITTTDMGPNHKKSHKFIPLLFCWVGKKLVPSFMTIVLVDARFRDDIEGDSVDLISKSSPQRFP